MRDLIAGLIALGLFVFALRLASTLRFHRRDRQRERDELSTAGRSVLAEIPTRDGLELFVADDTHFFWQNTTIAKDRIGLVRVLINGTPLASYSAQRFAADDPGDSGSFTDRPEGIAHDRWDVLIRADADTLVECGSVRERVSQALARRVFDAVRDDMEHRDSLMKHRDSQAQTGSSPA